MRPLYKFNETTSVWNEEKARRNIAKHKRITFEEATESFFDPFVIFADATRNYEQRDGIIGRTSKGQLLFPSTSGLTTSISGSYRLAEQQKINKDNIMKINDLKKRLRKNRPTSVIQLRIPDDVIDDLRRVAPKLDTPDYQALICYYVGKCLREDLERLEASPAEQLAKSPEHQGVPEETVNEAVADMAYGQY